MNLKDWAEENGKTLAEAKELTGLTHWNQTITESCDEIPEINAEADISELVVKEEPVAEMEPKELTPEQAFSILILGNKSPHWRG